MGNIKRMHPASFKAKVALELIKEIDTVAVICSKYSIHPSQAYSWKSLALTGLQASLSDKPLLELKAKDEIIDELYKQIGQLKVEMDWLKKKVGAI